uniref:Uncharacterized protein n=1 Tax=Arundo donax TaxID=35708 RepID=A0A0A9HVI5_ARUDO
MPSPLLLPLFCSPLGYWAGEREAALLPRSLC